MASLPPDLAETSGQSVGAIVRAAQIAGAVDAALEMSVAYAGERLQFGRPIGAFQAIQHQIARLAAEAAAAGMAADQACRALDAGDGISFWTAAAKVRAGTAAGAAAAIAHQVHGAMGFTREHRLHTLTRRLWSWRSEFGAERAWAERLGALVHAAGPDGLWPLVTSATPAARDPT